MEYVRSKDKSRVKRKLQPVAIMFSEYYFYMAAFIQDEAVRKDFDVINDSFPTIYRIDRIKKLRVLDERFHIPPIPTALRKGSFGNGFSSCLAGNCRK